MNQFNKFKDFVHGNLSKNDRQIMSSMIMKEEKHVDNIKSILTTAEKKLSNSLMSPRKTGSDQVASEKKTKKFPSTSLNKFFNEASETLSTSKNDSVLSKTLLTCSQLQNEFTNTLAEHESYVERDCLNVIEKYLNEDLPSIHRTRKQLTKANEELKAARAKYESFMKTISNSTQTNSDMIQNKIEPLRKEVEYSEQKLEQSRDAYEIEIFDFLGKELTISEIFFQYIKLLEIYHERMLQQIRHYIPILEGVLQNSSQKPVFGVPLEEHIRSSGKKISLVIEKCVEYLWPFVREEGIFRISGSISKVKRMRNAFNAGRLEALNELKNDAPAVVSTLKSYLRELPEPLLTFRLYPNWAEASKESDLNERLKAIWTVCNMLPEANRNNLCYLMKFLHELTKHSERNKMSSQNLAIALGPSLLWPKGDSYDLSMSNYLPTLVEALITYCDYFFPDEIYSSIKTITTPTTTIDNYNSSFSDNSDPETSTMPTSPNHSNQQRKLNDKKKKAPAPKPPPTITSTSQLPILSSGDLGPTGSLNVTPSKLCSKVGSFKFKTNSNLKKLSPENVKNMFVENKSQQTIIGNRVESPPAAVYLSASNQGIYLRKSPTPEFQFSTFHQTEAIKIRPKSVYERPTVAPPSVPPKPSPVQKPSNYSNSQQPNNVESVDKYPELNHIDSESEDQNSNSSLKEMSEVSTDQQQSPQQISTQFDYNKLNSDEPAHSTSSGEMDKDNDDVYYENRDDRRLESTSTPPPRKPPRTHSSNSSGSSSNLSLNNDNENINMVLHQQKTHQRSASTISNNNNNPNDGDTSKLDLNSAIPSPKLSIKHPQQSNQHQTHL